MSSIFNAVGFEAFASLLISGWLLAVSLMLFSSDALGDIVIAIISMILAGVMLFYLLMYKKNEIMDFIYEYT